MRYPSAVFTFIVGPLRFEWAKNGQTILTHLQKYSRCGFLITWPFCIHIWFFWKKQATDCNLPHDTTCSDHWCDSWIPGTEQGVYARTPGYRWDADLGMKWTWGYVGGHWD